MKDYTAIIFDLDGTLLDTSEGIYNAVRSTEKIMHFTPVDDTTLPEYVDVYKRQTYRGISSISYFSSSSAGISQAESVNIFILIAFLSALF